MAFSEFPTVAHQLYQLAGGERTALELTRRSLAAIEASQPTLNAFRVVLAERALATAAEADRRRAHRLAMRAFEPGGLGYDDYEELAGLLPSLTVEQLRSVRAAVGASWGGQRLKRQGMVDTLVAFARQQAAPAEQDAPGSPGWQARMMNREPQPKPGVDAWESAKVDDAADRAGRMGAWESDRPDSEAAGAVAGAARADLAGARGWAADVATATPGLSSPPPADNRLDDKLDNPEPEPAAKLASRLDELEADASRRLAEAERPLTGNRYADVSDADLGAVRHRLAAKVAGLKQSATATGDEAVTAEAKAARDRLADLRGADDAAFLDSDKVTDGDRQKGEGRRSVCRARESRGGVSKLSCSCLCVLV